MSERIEFRLSMPGVGSWNGRWSGDGRKYVIVRTVRRADLPKLGDLPRSWRYSWDDGWAASVSARVMTKGERKPKSDGFCGYDWMVNNIIRWGTPECQHEMHPDPNSGKPGYPGEWERCRWCGMGVQISEATP